MGDRGTPEDGDAERLRALETVVDVAGLGTWRWDAGADEVHLDAVLRRILGFPGEACALGAAELFESVHPDDRPGFRAALLSVRTGKRRVVVRELRFRTSTSAWKWVELRATQRDGAGNVLGVVRDIAKRRATQDEAQRLGRELRQVVESIPGCVYRCTYEAPWSTLYASESFEELTGFTAEQFVNQEVSFEELVHPQDIAFLRLEVEQSIRERRPYELRYRIENRDGHGRWVLDRGSAVHDPRTGRVVELAGVLVDISEQQAQEEQVRVLGSALATATDAVLITAAEPLADGPPILWANEAFTEQTGYALHELIGESPRLFQGPDSPREPLARIRAALEAWQPVQVELLNYRKDGTPYWSELSIVPLADETGWYTHWVSVQRDITARIEAAEETERQAETLREARDAAERATKAKSAFLATMSHEIRTPLNGIIGMTSLLQGTELSSEQRDFVSTIRASGDTLLTVINDILDFSKIEAGQVELELQPFELVECLESALELVCVAARRKGVGLQYVMGPGVPERVEGDITRLRQVLVNLLGNAVKFTGEGHVVLRVLAGDAPDQLHFRVEDTGIGIPKERRARLFKAFSQVDASITRRFGGTGLGLAICRQLVERMGGAIDVESEDGKGSTFFFDATLPARPASPDLLFRDAQRAFGGQRVGVALGWEPSDAFAAELLRRVGAEVVRDPAAPVDVAFVAAESGWGGVAARVLPVRLSAAAASSPTELELPLRRFTFFRHVLPRLGHELSAEGSGAAHQAAECSLRVLLAEDNAVNQKVATKLLQRLGITPDVASNGAEAVELVHQARYDLILMDMQMPVMDGLQATRTIRESGLDPQPRILALTANAMPEDRKRCLDAGMDGFLAKPLRLETLRKAVLEPTPSISPAAA